ncbi:MAG: sulfatase-like hydrolase/transferase [Verrucomicrobiales bacterium]|nr:sulfatase-like hydrolase/transferase [Verrucomicrobiales bacterium]
MKAPVLTLTLSLTCLASGPGASPPGTDPLPRRNVLFIITDQQSADALSCRSGTRFLNTPAMDSLAARGVLFSRAYSSNPLCMPWRNSVFTGRYPHETGVTRNALPEGGLDPAEFVSLGTYFQRAGYDAAYSGKWHLVYDPKDPTAHGFDIVTRKVSGNHDAGVTAGAIRFLTQPHERPFMLVAKLLVNRVQPVPFESGPGGPGAGTTILPGPHAGNAR